MSLGNHYNWNSTLEINNQKLLDEFTKRPIPEKIFIWRLLNTERRKALKKLWEKEQERKSIAVFLEHAKHVLSALGNNIMIGDSIKDSAIKNTYELWLICGIIDSIGVLPLSEDSAVDIKHDQESFEKTRKKMLEYLFEFERRKWGPIKSEASLKNQLIRQIDELEYIRPSTKKGWELKEREEILHMMYVAGIGKERAKSLYNALKQWSQNAPKDRYSICNFEWKIEKFKNDYSEISLCLDQINSKNMIDKYGFSHLHSEMEGIYNNAIINLKKHGIPEDNDYAGISSTLAWEEKKLRNGAVIERNHANNYYSHIRKEAVKQYPDIFQ